MKLRIILLFVGFSLAATVPIPAEKPNVLFIMADDLGPMLGAYGDPFVRTPNLDQLAAEGVLFDRAYSQVAVCGPSRASLMSGLRMETLNFYYHGSEELKIFRSEFGHVPTMPAAFKALGYRTYGFGKIYHRGWVNPDEWSAPFFAGRDREMWEIADLESLEGVPFANRAEVPTLIADRFNCPVMQAPDVPDNALFAGRMTDRVLELLPQLGDEPFFLAVGFRRPHLPFVAPKKYFDLYNPDTSWLPNNRNPPKGAPIMAYFNSDSYARGATKIPSPPPDEASAVAWNGFEMRSYNGVPEHGNISDDQQIELRRAYLACVSYVDAQIGRLMDGMRVSGKLENTIVVFLSDHGFQLGEQGIWTKRTNYERSTRVPLIIRSPGEVPRQTRILGELVDVYPTLFDLAGLPIPAHLEGESLAEVVRGTTNGKDAGIALSQFTRYDTHMGRAIRTDRWRYVEWTAMATGEVVHRELYDHMNDPEETVNRVGESAYAAQIDQLSAELQRAYGLNRHSPHSS